MLLALASLALATPAPSVQVAGLELGRSADSEVDAWLADRAIDCTSAAAPRRTTVQWDCRDAVVPEVEGAVDRLLLARLDDGPLHHWSVDRSHRDPAQAIAAWEAARERLVARFGSPEREVALQPDVPPYGRFLRATAQWTFDDLRVVLTLMRAAGTEVHVSERWDVPGAEDRATARPGSRPHGGAPARNPHLRD